MPLKLPILPRKHNSVDDPKEPYHLSATTAATPPYSRDLLHPHPTHNRRPSDSTSYGGPSHYAPASVRGSTSTVPSSSGPRTPPPMSIAQENNPNFFDQVVFEPPMPGPGYMKPAAAPDEHQVSVFSSQTLSAPSAAAFVTTRSSSRQELSWQERMSPSNGGYFGSGSGLQVAQSDDELLSLRAKHSRNDSMGYYYGNGSAGRLETSSSSHSLDKMLQKSPEQLERRFSTLNLSDDDREESDESFAERNRRSEAELMRKGAEELKRRGTVEASTATGVPGSPEDAKVQLPPEVVSYLQKSEYVPAPAPGLLTREKRVMTVPEFEKYRRMQAESPDLNDDDKDENSESDNEGFFKSDSDSEMLQEALELKHRQEANLAVYRQQMRKITGNSAPPPPPPPVPGSRSMSRLSLLLPEDEDDEIPLAILHAHGLPGRHRGTPPSIASRPMSLKPASIYPSQMQVQSFPPAPPPVSYPRGLTLPEQMLDLMFDPHQHQMPTPRGLIHEIAREEEAKLHRRSMLNMHMQTGSPYDIRPVSPFQRGSMLHSPQPPAPYMYPPSPQLLPMQPPVQPSMQPSMQPQIQPSMQPQMQPSMQPPDNSGISPDLQMQMQKFLGLQMQMMQQMMQGSPQLSSPVHDAPRRIPSPANSVRASTYSPTVAAPPGNLQGQAPAPLLSSAANPPRYRTLSTQHSLTNLNYQYEMGAPSVPDSRSSQDYPPRPQEQPGITHRLGGTVEGANTVRIVDNNKELAPALPILTPLSSASAAQGGDAQDEPYYGGAEDNESREWERLRKQKSTLRKAWKLRRSVNVSSSVAASTSETAAESEVAI
ncbi:uncharacterized protein V1513DRAFT_446202 [Lipomyces chichibuensis]|uniref:uncharacterized protein n=1 Tax=Lipomyces chichibuensis TaxID=1546026 RepID=UPI003342E795